MKTLAKDTKVVIYPKSPFREVHTGETATITGPVVESDDVVVKLAEPALARYRGQYVIQKEKPTGEKFNRKILIYELLAQVRVLPVEPGTLPDIGVEGLVLPTGLICRLPAELE